MTVVALDQESHAYPVDLLDECSSALLLFCSGRMGAADGWAVREAKLRDVTAVDWDGKTLAPFSEQYPDDWTYVVRDAWEYVEAADRLWDLVSADPPSQYRDQMVSSLIDWTSVASKFVVATVMQPAIHLTLDGWQLVDVIPRASYPDGRDYFWAVVGRA